MEIVSRTENLILPDFSDFILSNNISFLSKDGERVEISIVDGCFWVKVDQSCWENTRVANDYEYEEIKKLAKRFFLNGTNN